MKTINARDLRNEYARVLQEVRAGESFTILSRGQAVARLTSVPEEESVGPEAEMEADVVRRRTERRDRFSGVLLRDVVGLNVAAGPFDHGTFWREQDEFWSDDSGDPYAVDVRGAGPGSADRTTR